MKNNTQLSKTFTERRSAPGPLAQQEINRLTVAAHLSTAELASVSASLADAQAANINYAAALELVQGECGMLMGKVAAFEARDLMLVPGIDAIALAAATNITAACFAGVPGAKLTDRVRELVAEAMRAGGGGVPVAPNLKNGFLYHEGLDIKAVLYTDDINGQQVLRDDLWLATTESLNALRAPAAIPPAAGPSDDDELKNIALSSGARGVQPVAYWDKAVGGFYIAGAIIPEAVKQRITPLYANPALPEAPEPAQQGAQELADTIQHPVQPLVHDTHGRLRFKRNAIVDFLADGRLNDLAAMDFDAADWEQLAQLIGYSLSGFGNLSYVTDETYDRAAAQAPASQEPQR